MNNKERRKEARTIRPGVVVVDGVEHLDGQFQILLQDVGLDLALVQQPQ